MDLDIAGNNTVSEAELHNTMASILLADILKERRSERRWKLFRRFMIASFFIGGAVLYAMFYTSTLGIKVNIFERFKEREPELAVVRISGTIGELVTADTLIPAIRSAFEAKTTKAVVLQINSPGGAPGDAERIGHPIPHNSLIIFQLPLELASSRVLHDPLQPNPDRLHSGLAVALAPEKPAQRGHKAHDLVERRRCLGRSALVEDEGRLPLVTLEQQLGFQIRTGAPQAHQPGNPPRHHHEQHQRTLQALERRQLQRFDLAAVLEHMKEQLDLPACAVPVDQLHRRLEVGRFAVGEQAPFERLHADGRVDFAGDHAARLDRIVAADPDPDPLGAYLLMHRTGLLALAGGQIEADLAQRLGRQHAGPQLVAIGQRAVVLRAQQPVGRRAQVARTRHQRRNIRLPIGHIHQTRFGHVRRPFGNPLVAFDPAHALDDPVAAAGLGLELARPHPGVDHPQRFARARHHVGRMKVHAALRLVGQRPQSGDGLTVEIELGRVLDAQRHRLCRHALHRAGHMRIEQILPADVVVAQQAVRRLRLGPAPTRRRNARHRLRRQALGQQHRASVQASIAQVEGVEFVGGPAHGCSVSAEVGGGRIVNDDGVVWNGMRIGSFVREMRLSSEIPIHAVIEGIGASAAYLIAMETDSIYAGRYSLVGSIGAVLSAWEAHQLLDRIGVQQRTFSSGELKSMLNPFAPPNEEGNAKAQSLVDEMGEMFREDLMLARAKKLTSGIDYGTGEVWNGVVAQEIGLVDEIGTIESIQSKYGLEKLRVYRPFRPYSFMRMMAEWAQDLGMALPWISEGYSYELR